MERVLPLERGGPKLPHQMEKMQGQSKYPMLLVRVRQADSLPSVHERSDGHKEKGRVSVSCSCHFSSQVGAGHLEHVLRHPSSSKYTQLLRNRRVFAALPGSCASSILLANPKSGEKHPSPSRKNGALWGIVAALSAYDKRLIPTPMGFARRIKLTSDACWQAEQ